MQQQQKKGLYWIDGMIPTQEDREAAAVLGIRAFRNAQQATDHGLEKAEIVAGCAPEGYSRMEGCHVITAEQVKIRKERQEKAAQAQGQAKGK